MNTKEREALNARLDAVIARNQQLDSAAFLLSTSSAKLKIMADAYATEVSDIMYMMLDRDMVSRVTEQAAQDFTRNLASALKSGKLKLAGMNRERMIQGVVDTWENQVGRVTDSLASNVVAKGVQFSALAKATEIPQARLTDIAAHEIESVTIANQMYYKQPLENLWDRMNAAYGQRDTIQYRNGVNYPLTTYIDQRVITSESETHRLASIIEGSANGIYFGTTNKTGTTDSCIYHEGEIFFLTDAARDEALQQWPNEESLQSMRTWQEIVNDNTHMGKFGCKHIVRPMALQFTSEKRMTETLNDPEQKAKTKADAIPAKINEQKVFEETTGRKWVNPPYKKPDANYNPVTEPLAPLRYTIA